MIFQPSHRQRLSGSKPIVAFCLMLLLSGCFTSKKTTTRRSTPSRTDVLRKPEKKKIDTAEIKIVENPQVITDETPILGDRLPESIKKDRYKISLLIPFKADNALSTPEDEAYSGYHTRFINYYAGAKLALEELARSGVKLDVDVYDSRSSLSEVKKLLNLGKVRESDVIIGPYNKDAVKWVADWAKDKQITHVSPWISSTSIAKENPFYLQTKSGLLKHYATLMDQGLSNHPGAEKYVVLKKGDDRKMRYVDYTLKELDIDRENPPFDTLHLIPDTLTYGQMVFDSTFFAGSACQKVFIVPYASSKDGVFVYDFLRRINIEQQDCEVVIYGMYKWLDYQDEMFELMNAMDVKLTISNLVSPLDPKVRFFKRTYLNKYGALPEDAALEGYDDVMYVGKMLKEHGQYFQFALEDSEPIQGSQTVYDVYPERNESTGKIDYFENYFIDLIKIEDFKFQRAVR